MGGVTNYLLDTHTLLWWLFDDPKLSEAARCTIANPEHRLWVSAAPAWEIATKARLGKLPEAGDVPVRLEYYLPIPRSGSNRRLGARVPLPDTPDGRWTPTGGSLKKRS